jgi:hypothetical protein
MEKIQKYLPSLTTGPEVIGMAQVMLIHDGDTSRRIPSQRFLGIFTHIHLLSPVWKKYKVPTKPDHHTGSSWNSLGDVNI